MTVSYEIVRSYRVIGASQNRQDIRNRVFGTCLRVRASRQTRFLQTTTRFDCQISFELARETRLCPYASRS
jgi:hypothetical protein